MNTEQIIKPNSELATITSQADKSRYAESEINKSKIASLFDKLCGFEDCKDIYRNELVTYAEFAKVEAMIFEMNN